MKTKKLNLKFTYIIHLDKEDREKLNKLQVDYNMAAEFRKFIRKKYTEEYENNN